MKTWLLLDANFLCWRAFHSMGDLSHKAIKTGVIYGFLREIITMQDGFGTTNVAFCFDHKQPKRREELECYKAKRHATKRTEEEEEARADMRRQVDLLRTDYLPRIGYRNIFAQEGYEADDIIASLCMDLSDEDEAIIVSSDGDLYQLLRHNVMMHDPQKMRTHTLQSFTKRFGIEPKWWWRVLALKGCDTDEVPGIDGVGLKTALKWLRSELKPESKVFQRIASAAGRAIYKRNIPIVRLPYAGVEAFTLRPDKLSGDGYLSVCEELGIKSLQHRSPLTSRAQRRSTGFGFGL